MSIKTLVSRGTTNTAVARLMGCQGPVHYHVSRMVTGAVDPVAALSGSLAARVSPTARYRKPTPRVPTGAVVMGSTTLSSDAIAAALRVVGLEPSSPRGAGFRCHDLRLLVGIGRSRDGYRGGPQSRRGYGSSELMRCGVIA